jgi:DNA repair protein RadA/Sms
LQAVKQTNLDEIFNIIDDAKPRLVVIDSAQTLACFNPITDEELETGSPKAIGVAIQAMRDYAHREKVSFIVIGHVTKDGTNAGGRSGLDHAVDTMLYFDGDQGDTRRVLKCDSKNRFGETGFKARVYFEMTDKGLVVVDKNEKKEEELNI